MPEEAKDLSFLSVEDLRTKITSRAKTLNEMGYLPNGLSQLVVGSVQYRPITLFMETGANAGLYKKDLVLMKDIVNG
jgi:hypothetical protein